MYVYLGSLAMDVSFINTQPDTNPQTQIIQWSLRLIGLLATVIVSIYIAKIAKRSLLWTLEKVEAKNGLNSTLREE